MRLSLLHEACNIKEQLRVTRHMLSSFKLLKMNDFREFDFIKSLTSKAARGLDLGIGDDAALIKASEQWAISTDSMVESSHFSSGDSPRKIAQKLVRINLSDMAAMGCEPRFFLLNLHFSKSWNLDQLNEFKSGLLEELKQRNLSLIGGDTVSVSEGPIHLVGTILGQPYLEKAITRSGAQEGDDIYVTGFLGGSFPNRHLSFEPRNQWSHELCLNAQPNAMMDISDGLFQDLGHILDASEVSAKIELDEIPIHSDLKHHPEALNKALSDGEDFELLFTLAPEKSTKIPSSVHHKKIGKVITGKGEIFAKKKADLEYIVWPRLGFEHTAHLKTQKLPI